MSTVRPPNECKGTWPCETPGGLLEPFYTRPQPEDNSIQVLFRLITDVTAKKIVNPLFNKVDELADELQNKSSKYYKKIGLKGTYKHVSQRTGDNKSDKKFECRHAVFSGIRSYLVKEKGISRGDSLRFLPTDLLNKEVASVNGGGLKLPKKLEYALNPGTESLGDLTHKIDRLLENGCPAPVYVAHSDGLHVVTVTSKVEILALKIYFFDDPGTKNPGKATSQALIYDQQKGNFVKNGREEGPVVMKEFAVAGVYDYFDKMQEVLSQSETKKSRRAG